MKRTTIFLDEATLLRLQRTARREGKSAALLVREAVTRYLDGPTGESRVPSVAGKFTSGKRNTAEKVEEYLWRDPHA